MSFAPSRSPSTVLLDALDLLSSRGWCRGSYCEDESSPTSSLCLVGAINCAVGVEPWDIGSARGRGAEPAYWAIAAELGLPEPDEEEILDSLSVVEAVAAWSDDASRTLDDVAMTLRAASLACC